VVESECLVFKKGGPMLKKGVGVVSA